MKHQLAELADQRCRLLNKIEAQRVDVADIAYQLKKPIKYFDTGLIAARFVYRHPTLVAGSLAAILTFFRNGIPGINYLMPPILRFAFNRIVFNSREINSDMSKLNSEE
jgi:hypothetical protein